MPSELDDMFAGLVGSARGRRQAPLSLRFVRELGESDLDLLLNPPPQGQKTSALSKIRTVHHTLAKLLAEGRKDVQVSQITGYSQSRICILKKDPAFMELLAYYQGQLEKTYTDVHERMAQLGLTAVEELQERLETQPEAFTQRELLDVAEKMLDRGVPALTGSAVGKGNSVPTGGSQTLIQVQFVSPGGPKAPQLEATVLDFPSLSLTEGAN